MITNQIGTVILGIALLLSLQDIYGHSKDEYDDDEVFKKEFDDEKIDEKLKDADYIRVRQKSIIGLGKIVFIVLIVMEQDPFASMNSQHHAFSNGLEQQSVSCMMLFLLSNTIESSLMSTVAFEIYLGDEQIWSKLGSGRVPSPPELVQIVDQQMELQGVGPRPGLCSSTISCNSPR
uniref:Uncharacterized protein n=1 Tax=Wuchereria bancrofti TaxID=6293 RepID=A0A1I8EC40_WUCBA